MTIAKSSRAQPRRFKVGGVDDPIWDEPGSPPPPPRRPRHPARTAVLVVAVFLIVGACITWLVWPGNPSGGDPGGRVMNQLTPTVSSIPGYGTAALPWVHQIPPSLDASYIMKMEPKPDSCDGRPGTQGWSQVVVQSGFRWDGGLASLVAYMEPRLADIGWTLRPQPLPSNPPGQSWTKTLANGTRAYLGVGQEGSNHWELVAEGEPVGRAASGC
jgi:hypothetical protein